MKRTSKLHETMRDALEGTHRRRSGDRATTETSSRGYVPEASVCRTDGQVIEAQYASPIAPLTFGRSHASSASARFDLDDACWTDAWGGAIVFDGPNRSSTAGPVGTYPLQGQLCHVGQAGSVVTTVAVGWSRCHESGPFAASVTGCREDRVTGMDRTIPTPS